MKLKREGSEVLSQVAQPISLNENVSEMLLGMWAVLRQHKGAGLAANQVGVLKRIIIVNTKGFAGVIINPVITKRRGNKRSVEGCLSFPGKRVTMTRSSIITVVGFDEKWQPVKKKLRGFSSFCVQHEIDHLNGITIND